MHLDRLFVLERVLAQLDQLAIERLFQTVILRSRYNAARPPAPTSGLCRIALRSMWRAFQCSIASLASRHSTCPTISSSVRKPNCAMYSRNSSRDEHHEVDHVLGLALELLAQLRVLGRDPDRAGIEMADPHHDAARGDQRRGREAEFLGAEQRRDRHVAAGLELAVGLDADAPAQIVQHQGLLGLGQAQLPRRSRVLDRTAAARRRCRRRVR